METTIDTKSTITLFDTANSVIVLFVSIVVSMEVNRRHYFRSGPRICIYIYTHTHTHTHTHVYSVLIHLRNI